MSAYLLVASEASTIVRPANLYYNINIVAIIRLEISLILAQSFVRKPLYPVLLP